MYVEHAITGFISSAARCTWHQVFERSEVARVVPDACTDILWNGRTLNVAGPDTRPMPQPFAAGASIVAIRFAPGSGPRILGASGASIRNARVDLIDLWGDRAKQLAEDLSRETNVARQRALLERAVSAQLRAASEPDALILEAVRRLSNTLEAPSVAKLARSFGITERQLLRRSNFALGYGPKQLARILRFQSFMNALRGGATGSLAELAMACGYHDQSHLAHETAEFAGATPGQLQSELHNPIPTTARGEPPAPAPIVETRPTRSAP